MTWGVVRGMWVAGGEGGMELWGVCVCGGGSLTEAWVEWWACAEPAAEPDVVEIGDAAAGTDSVRWERAGDLGEVAHAGAGVQHEDELGGGGEGSSASLQWAGEAVVGHRVSSAAAVLVEVRELLERVYTAM